MKIKLLSVALLIASMVQAQELKTHMDSVSYAVGIMFAQNLKTQGVEEVNTELLLKAMNSLLKNQPTAITSAQAGSIYSEHTKQLRMKQGEKVRLEGEKFLAENKTRKGIVTTASGLQYEVMKEGTGAKPKLTDKVKVHYHGTLLDGTVFDSSVERGTPASFPLNGVIQGWQEGVQLMTVGSKYKFYIPFNLAYGERGSGAKIKPFSALVFEVELISIGE